MNKLKTPRHLFCRERGFLPYAKAAYLQPKNLDISHWYISKLDIGAFAIKKQLSYRKREHTKYTPKREFKLQFW